MEKVEHARAIVMRAYQWIVDARKDFKKFHTDSEWEKAMDNIDSQLQGKDKDNFRRVLHLFGETSGCLTETLGALQNCLADEIKKDE